MPIAYFFTTNSTKADVYADLTRNVIQAVHETSLRIRAMVCDAATRNVAMYKLLGAKIDKPIFFISEKIFTIIDPPHLLKALRNCLAEYIIRHGSETYDWADMVSFYKLDKMPARIAPKLTDAHIDPYSIKRMSVSKATQIFSSQVAAGMFTHAAYSKFLTFKSKLTFTGILIFVLKCHLP